MCFWYIRGIEPAFRQSRNRIAAWLNWPYSDLQPYICPTSHLWPPYPGNFLCIVWSAPSLLFHLLWFLFSSLSPGSSLSPYLCCHPRSWHKEHYPDVLSSPYQTSRYLDIIQRTDFLIFLPRVGLWLRQILCIVWFSSGYCQIIYKGRQRVRESSGFEEINLNLAFEVSFTEIRNMCKICISLRKCFLFKNPAFEGVRSGNSREIASSL